MTRAMIRPVLWAILAVSTLGCAKRVNETSAPGAEPPGDELVQLEKQLIQREGELQAVGVTPVGPAPSERDAHPQTTMDVAGASVAEKQAGGVPSSQPAPSTAPTEEKPTDPQSNRCEQVCEIAAAICSLEDQICGLLPRHRGDPRYQAACDRSAADCQLANEACHACNPT